MLAKFCAAVCVSALAAAAQTAPHEPAGAQLPTPVTATQAPVPAGIQAPWDIRQMLAAMNAEIGKLKPLFDDMHPQQWLENGAPPTYASQYLEARSRLDDVVRAVKSLSSQTESLSVALDTYFRMEALEVVSRSLRECIQKYGERRTADQLSSLMADLFTNRQKFQQYLRDLSIEREQECKIADDEAQRCRGIISRESPTKSDSQRSRKK